MARLLGDVDGTLAAIRHGLESGGIAPARRSSRSSPSCPRSPGRARSSPSAGTTASTPPKRASTAPADPVVFAKFPSSLIGDGADIAWRAADTRQVDYEAELAVVIGRTARDVPTARALDHVLGYSCLNDVSARDLQFGDGQWVRGKSLDTFCPMGPWIVTADELADPGVLGIRCLVNGEVVQDARTAEMVHRRRRADRLLLAVHDPRTRRRHRDRDAGRGGRLPRSAPVPRRW